ncbi:hypothetical protein K1719_021694 [Acacia pycnantha]|nr:hypothetical protein K1719_021694 [Acacia pycnantha]
MSVKMRTTNTRQKDPMKLHCSLGLALGLSRGLGGGGRRPPSGPEPSVRYHSGRARILTLCQDLRAKGHSRVDSFYGA